MKPDGFGSEISPAGVGLFSHPNQFCHGSGFYSTQPKSDPLPSLAVVDTPATLWPLMPSTFHAPASDASTMLQHPPLSAFYPAPSPPANTITAHNLQRGRREKEKKGYKIWVLKL
jgi:hypothetical protein